MAKRNNRRRVASTEIQGEGSYIIVSSMSYGENRDVALNHLEGEEKLRRNEANVIAHLHGWDWVDDEGMPLPLPSTDRAVLDILTGDEWNFIVEAINGSPNGSSG